ncbi:MAG: type II secretion system F family protein [Acidobacteria bacterium]|nr:type II secretion system F family protein [Acidobacteriota bacterium]
MGLAILVFVVLFAVVAVIGFVFSTRNPMTRRVEDVVAGSSQGMELDLTRGAPQQSAFTSLLERVGTSVPQGKQETTSMRQSLIRAGYRESNAVNLMYGIKVVFPVFLVLLILFAWHTSNLFPYIIAGGVGYLLPDYALQRLIHIRQKKIKKGLPDALDLLVICVEAGLSLDQALARTSKELGVAHPELSDELNLVVLEQAAGSVRGDAWRHLAERTGVDNVRHLVTTIIQAEQFGTSIAKTLRVHSETLRLKRKQMLEEQAAKTSVKLVFPLVLFIFPSILLVTLGPALLAIAKVMPTLLHHG